MIATEKQPFKPTAVLITEAAEFKDGNRIAVDPNHVTLLHLDSNDNAGWLYTREEWDRVQDEPTFEPRIYRDYGSKHVGLQEGERVELLPDMWVVKIDEKEHWLDPVVLDKTNRLYGVYVFDRRRHVHCCSFEATYELTFLGSQWDYTRELDDDETNDLDERIREGDGQCESVSYWGTHDIECMIANACREGCLPAKGNGGYKIDVVSVVTDDAIAELEEANQGSEL